MGLARSNIDRLYRDRLYRTMVFMRLSVCSVSAGLFVIGALAGELSAKTKLIWDTVQVSIPIVRQSPEAAREEARYAAQIAIYQRGERELSIVSSLSTKEENGRAVDDYWREVIERTNKTIVDDTVLCDSVSRTVGPGGRTILVQWLCLAAQVSVEEVDKDAGPSPLQPTLKLNGAVFEEGDSLRIEVGLREDSYLYIFDITSDGTVIMFYPRRAEDTAQLRGGTVFSYPPVHGTQSVVELYLEPGQERANEYIRVVTTRYPLRFSPHDIDSTAAAARFVRMATTTRRALEAEVVQLAFRDRGQASAAFVINRKTKLIDGGRE